MTAAELERTTKQRLSDAGLLSYIDTERSQFLDLPDSTLIEVVVNDGTKLGLVERVIGELKERSPKELDAIVRAIWVVKGVADPIQAYSMGTGSPRAAISFPVDLISGDAIQRAQVEVTYLAQQTLKEHGVTDLKPLVADYVRAQLRKGGASYWDPVRFPNLEIHESTATFLLSRKSA